MRFFLILTVLFLSGLAESSFAQNPGGIGERNIVDERVPQDKKTKSQLFITPRQLSETEQRLRDRSYGRKTVKQKSTKTTPSPSENPTMDQLMEEAQAVGEVNTPERVTQPGDITENDIETFSQQEAERRLRRDNPGLRIDQIR